MNPKVTFEMENGDTMVAELYPEMAPNTVNNFISLVKKGFYDGLTFHRIIDGFMIQGGQGGDAPFIKGEFESNGVPNDISHVRGTISMARAQAPDSASSQFFIVHQDSQFLDGNYAAFGHVTEGMEVVDAICEKVAPLAVDDNGTILPDDQPVITSIQVVQNP